MIWIDINKRKPESPNDISFVLTEDRKIKRFVFLDENNVYFEDVLKKEMTIAEDKITHWLSFPEMPKQNVESLETEKHPTARSFNVERMLRFFKSWSEAIEKESNKDCN